MTTDVSQQLMDIALAARSPAYRWLEKHRSEILPILAGHTRPPWKALSEAAAQHGEVFKPDTLRKAWLRLDEDRKRAKEALRQPDPPVVKPRNAAAPPVAARVIGRTPDSATAAEDERPQIIEPGSRFRWNPPVDRAKPPKKES